LDRIVPDLKESAFPEPHDRDVVHLVKLTDAIVPGLTEVLDEVGSGFHVNLAVVVVGVDLEGDEAESFE